MKKTAITIGQGGSLSLESEPKLSPDWLEDGEFRWLNVEGANREDTELLFDQLGVEGSVLADHIWGDAWLNWIERELFLIKPCPAPTSWLQYESWFHLTGLPETIVTVHAAEIPVMQDFIKAGWLDRPGPDAAADALLLHVAQCFVEEEIYEFNKIRLKIEEHAEGLRIGDENFRVEDLEVLMTKCNHMAMVFFEHQALFEGIEFGRSRAIDLGSHLELFRRGASTVETMREGVEQVQRRLAELQQQHLMDQQARTDGRLRVLTIISAVFLPLTLIAGIYGMNFENMPELHADYAYYIVLMIMVAVGAGMVGYFARKGWFNSCLM